MLEYTVFNFVFSVKRNYLSAKMKKTKRRLCVCFASTPNFKDWQRQVLQRGDIGGVAAEEEQNSQQTLSYCFCKSCMKNKAKIITTCYSNHLYLKVEKVKVSNRKEFNTLHLRL